MTAHLGVAANKCGLLGEEAAGFWTDENDQIHNRHDESGGQMTDPEGPLVAHMYMAVVVKTNGIPFRCTTHFSLF